MSTNIRQILYIDSQDQPPAGFCDCCGKELYAPSCICLYCERRQYETA